MEIAAQLGATLFLLAVLVLLARCRERMTAENRDAYRSIVIGVGLLSAVATAFLAETTGAISAVPFLSESIFFRLTTTIISIAGVVLLSSGISTWLPISRATRVFTRTRITRLELIRKIEQVIDVEQRLTAILDKTLTHMINQIDLPGGAVYVTTLGSTDMRLLATGQNHDEFILNPDALIVRIADQPLPSATDFESIEIDVAGGVARPELILPVFVGRNPVAVFLLWLPAGGLDNDDRMLLLLARDIVARALHMSMLEDQVRYRRQADEFTRRLNALLAGVALSDAVVPLSRMLREVVPSELLSLTIVCGDHDIRRYTVGEHESLLTEKSLSTDSLRFTTDTNDVHAQPAIITDFEHSLEPGLAAMLRGGQYAGALHIPLYDGPRAIGQVILASHGDHAFRARHLQLAENLQSTLAGAVAAEPERALAERRTRQMETLHRMAIRCAENAADIEALFVESATALRRATGVAAVRIAIFEDEGTFIRSRALSSIHPIERGVPSNGYLVRSLMPLHQEVQETGESLLIDDTDTTLSMSTAEAQQIYQGDLNTALLHPIKAGGETIGIISLVDRRGTHRFRFGSEDRSFVASIAALLALASRLHDTPWGAIEHRDRTEEESEDRRREFSGRLRSSLTGIIGSVEMLRTHPSDADVDRYVRIIDRSARRIEAYLKTPESVG